MSANLIIQAVGPWPMNCYIVICETTRVSAIIDPGADAETILAQTTGTRVEHILITHGHPDHLGALAEIKMVTGAPIYIRPADAQKFGVAFDIPLQDGQHIAVGALRLRAIHTPGHTPGATCFDLGDGRVIVGDTIFVGGPGKTWSPKEFAAQMHTLQTIVFTWPDETVFYPGHGPAGKIGIERPAFEAFTAHGWPADLFGDVTWESPKS
jgi:glyoxylase-like metal-dependent hydrolase (beta-lactamase superfamily II)